MRGMSVTSNPRPMMFAIYDGGVLPKPNDAFAWVQATAGPALVCGALEPYAAHLFTTRAWPLGTAVDGNHAAAWGDVAVALGADGAHLVRLHQVHGTSFIARKRTNIARKQLDDGDMSCRMIRRSCSRFRRRIVYRFSLLMYA